MNQLYKQKSRIMFFQLKINHIFEIRVVKIFLQLFKDNVEAVHLSVIELFDFIRGEIHLIPRKLMSLGKVIELFLCL